MKKIIFENLKNFKLYIMVFIALIFVGAMYYFYLLWTTPIVDTRILETNGSLEQIWLTNQRIFSPNTNSTGYLYKPKFFDKIAIVELIGCSQMIIYDGEKAFVYHWDGATRTPEVRKYLKPYLESFKRTKKLEVIFCEAERTKSHNKINFDEILKDIYEITPNINCKKVVFSLPQKEKSFGIVYRYEIIFAFGKMFSCNKKLKLDSLYKNKTEFLYAGMGYWKKYYYYWNPTKDAITAKRKLFTREGKRKSVYDYSTYWDYEDNKKYDLPTTFEFNLSKFLYGVDNNKLNYYQYLFNEQSQRLEYKKLSEEEIKAIASYPILKIEDTSKKTVILPKSFLNKIYVLLYCPENNLDFEIRRKTINIRPLLISGVLEIKTFGRSHIKYENGLEITFWTVPETLYRLIKKINSKHGTNIEFMI